MSPPTSSGTTPQPPQSEAKPTLRPRGNLAWAIVPVLIFAALAALFGFALQSGDPSRLPSALIGRPAPALSFSALEGLQDKGQPVPGFAATDLTDGRVKLVNFWASWCGPCVEEHPLIVELGKRAEVPVYGINYKDTVEGARRFLGRYGNPYAAVGVDANGRGAIEWGVYGTPETFVVDGRGVITYRHVGPISAASLEKVILPAIAAAKAHTAPKP